MGGKPADSPLLARLRLPLSDEEHMPPEDRPQPSPEEIALLDRWIERGATQSLTLAELQLSEPLAKTAAGLPAKLAAIERAHVPAEPPWEFDPVEVDQKRAPLAGKVVALQRRFPGALSYESRTSAALHFTAVGFGRDFGDAELAELAALVTELVALDLSGTAITEASAAVLARFSRLRALRARYTELGDKTVEALAARVAGGSGSRTATAGTGPQVGDPAPVSHTPKPPWWANHSPAATSACSSAGSRVPGAWTSRAAARRR
jgi:hypothetical protein